MKKHQNILEFKFNLALLFYLFLEKKVVGFVSNFNSNFTNNEFQNVNFLKKRGKKSKFHCIILSNFFFNPYVLKNINKYCPLNKIIIVLSTPSSIILISYLKINHKSKIQLFLI